MTATKAPAPSTYRSGFCGVRAHERCRGIYSGVTCTCACHDDPEPEPEPLPRLEPGARVVCAPGTTWALEDLSGRELEVVEVHDYPPEVGGPVFVCRWPGTSTRPGWGICLQGDDLG